MGLNLPEWMEQVLRKKKKKILPWAQQVIGVKGYDCESGWDEQKKKKVGLCILR